MTDISQNNIKRIHFIGIGGCSMSGLALMFLSKGYNVQGSDVRHSPFTDMLEENGVSVFYGHNAENVCGCDLVVYSAAIPKTNAERVSASDLGIPELERRDALGQLSRQYKKTVGISGCHGKTTITSMLALISELANLNATVHIGGYVEFLRGGVKLGTGNTFITEACEYVESFLSLRPSIALINNIDDDHLNYYRDIEHITEAFEKYISLLPKEGGLLIANTDDFRVRGLYEKYCGEKLSYGLTGGDYFPENITYSKEGFPSFDLMHMCDGAKKKAGHIKLNIIGEYNILNAVAAAVTALCLGVGFEAIANALAKFTPARRRFEYYGEKNGVKIYHDYGHHPGEIRAVLSGAKRCPHNRLIAVFQCNSYSRAKTLFTKDVDCFADADFVLIPDIYPGRETDDGTVHARDMADAINKSGTRAIYISDFEGIRDYLNTNAQAGDLVVTLGSGDVYEKTRILL